MRLLHSLPLAALAALAAACGGSMVPDVASTTPAAVHPINPRAVVGPFVQAGTTLTIAIDQTIDTASSPEGQPFTAHTIEALKDPDGRVVIPAGALVRGRVASTGPIERPRLRLELDTIETPRGQARIDAVILHAQHVTYPGGGAASAVAMPTFADDYVYPYDDLAYGTGAKSRGPQPGVAYEEAYSRAVRIPRGAQISLELARPILPPGTGFRP